MVLSACPVAPDRQLFAKISSSIIPAFTHACYSLICMHAAKGLNSKQVSENVHQ